MSLVLIEQIINNIELAPDIYQMIIKSEYIAENARPGQFINIKCCEGINAVLRRPISICDVDKNKNHVTIVYQKRGAGTEFLSRKKTGDTLDLVGPLGGTFDITDKYRNIAVIGGGIGIFPLFFLLKESRSINKTAFIGFRSKAYSVLIDEYKKYSNDLFISTDDGSLGHKGFITDLFKNRIEQVKFDIIYTCGPEVMMKKVTQLALEAGLSCQVSLEQRMGCGIGACLACACKIKTKADNNISGDTKASNTKDYDGWKYKRVCKDGPVFWGEEVVFDE